MRSFKALFTASVAFAALAGMGMSSAFADAIPYPNPGTEASAHSFFASNTGNLTAYFYGTNASFTETLGLEVNGFVRAFGVFNNQTTKNGTAYDFGSVVAGDTLTFFINVLSTGDTFYSDASRNLDGINHVYTTSFSGDPVIPNSGTFVGFEDLRGGGDFNYQDEQFVFTNTASLSTVPLPASAPLFGAALLALGVVGYGVKRKAVPPVA